MEAPSKKSGGSSASYLVGAAMIVFIVIPLGVVVYNFILGGAEPVQTDNAFNVDVDDEELLRRDPNDEVHYEPKKKGPSSLTYIRDSDRKKKPVTKIVKKEPVGVIAAVLRDISWAVEFVKNPREFMYRETLIGKPEAAKAYLANPENVEYYLNFPATKVVMNNPKVAQALLKVPGVADIALKSPAARDKGVMRALVKSGLLDKAVESRTGQAFIRNPGMVGAITKDPSVTQTLMNPSLAQWLATSPNGRKTMQALGKVGQKR